MPTKWLYKVLNLRVNIRNTYLSFLRTLHVIISQSIGCCRTRESARHHGREWCRKDHPIECFVCPKCKQYEYRRKYPCQRQKLEIENQKYLRVLSTRRFVYRYAHRQGASHLPGKHCIFIFSITLLKCRRWKYLLFFINCKFSSRLDARILGAFRCQNIYIGVRKGKDIIYSRLSILQVRF